MEIKGFQGVSILDFPGKISSIIFTGGCNLRCPFCYNAELVLDAQALPTYPLDDIFSLLEERKNFIDAIVITGGEPTLHQGITDFLLRLKKSLPSKKIKLDTNGSFPRRLLTIIQQRLVDYVALDYKTPLSDVNIIQAPPDYADCWTESQNILRDSLSYSFYEYRTTLFTPYFALPVLQEMASLIKDEEQWFWQNYFSTNSKVDPAFDGQPLTTSTLQEWKKHIAKPGITIRGNT